MTTRYTRSSLALALLATTMLTQPAPARAAPNDALGPEFRINTTTSLGQRLPSVAMDAEGDFVVVWTSYSTSSSSDDIFARRYDAAGNALDATEFLVNTTTAGTQRGRRSVAMDADGDFVVVWSGNGPGDTYGIFARRYDAAGNALDATELLVNTTTANFQAEAAVAMDADGEFVVAWSGNGPGDSDGIFARRYDAAGNALDATEFLVNTHVTNTQKEPAVARDADGDFVVVWQSWGQDDPADYLGAGVYFQRYDAAGTKQGIETRANNTTTSDQKFPAVAMDADGDFVVAWAGYSSLTNPSAGVFARAFDAAGTAQGIEFPVNTTTNTIPQSNPAVAMDARGDFVVTWDSYGQDGSLEGVYARWFPTAQAVIGGGQTSEFPVNSYTTDDQAFPRVAMDADGDFVVAWESDNQDGSSYGVYAQRFEGVELVHGDFNGDGMGDVLWRNTSNGKNRIWLMDGATPVAHGPITPASTVPLAFQVAGIGDFNGDGKADVLWHNGSTGATRIWLMDGLTRLDHDGIGSPWPLCQVPSDCKVESVRDFNGDGMADILWHNNNTQGTLVWQMNGFFRVAQSGTGLGVPSNWEAQ